MHRKTCVAADVLPVFYTLPFSFLSSLFPELLPHLLLAKRQQNVLRFLLPFLLKSLSLQNALFQAPLPSPVPVLFQAAGSGP